MEKLSQILWRERELLDTLQFKLEVQQMVLASGRSRWLMRAARDVEAVLATIRETEMLRAIAADEAAVSVGVESNPSLSALADAAGEPWRSILSEHRDAFVAATREITGLADENRDLISAGYRSARETVMTLGDSPSGDVAPGAGSANPVVGIRRPRLVDGSR